MTSVDDCNPSERRIHFSNDGPLPLRIIAVVLASINYVVNCERPPLERSTGLYRLISGVRSIILVTENVESVDGICRMLSLVLVVVLIGWRSSGDRWERFSTCIWPELNA